jgi:hypothetical protein
MWFWKASLRVLFFFSSAFPTASFYLPEEKIKNIKSTSCSISKSLEALLFYHALDAWVIFLFFYVHFS